jgi:hypothetical protein
MAGARPFIDRSRRHIFLPLGAAAVIVAIAAFAALAADGGGNTPASGSLDRAATPHQPETFVFPLSSARHPTGSELWYAPPSWGYRIVLSPIDRVR